MWLFYFGIKYRKVSHQLAQIGSLELASLQLNDYKRIQLAIEEQQVREMFYAVNFQVILITNKSKITPKGHDELFDIFHNLLFHHSLVYINSLTLSNLFYIDKV